MDFPCGVMQEMVLPLALVCANEYPGNRYHGVQRMREIAEAAVRYMAKSSHADGTCDDYFPFERAMGALVFSLYSASETYQVLGMEDDQVRPVHPPRPPPRGRKRDRRLSNHQALAALAAYNIYKITGDDRARRIAEDRVEMTLSWQNQDEGWFGIRRRRPSYHTAPSTSPSSGRRWAPGEAR